MKRRYSLIDWTLRHPAIVLLITGLLVAFGVIALVVMPKQEFPTYTIRQGVVVGVYPGATSEEVEQQLAKPLEDFLFSFPEVRRDYTTTSSRNGICYAMVELNTDVSNKDEVWSKIKHGLTTLKMQLPSGVLALIPKDDFGDVSALLIAIESPNRSYAELKEYSAELGHQLRRIESVANVKVYGEQEPQITVYIDRAKLTSYGLNDKLVLAEVFTQSMTTGGSIKNEDVVVPLHLKATYKGVKEVEDQIIYAAPNGSMIRIKDVAKVVREYPEGTSNITYNGNPCLVLSVEMRDGFNIVKLGDDVNSLLDAYKTHDLPRDVTISTITDQSKVVNDSVLSFLRDLLMAIVVVIVVIMILFPWRSALVAAIVIPINTFISVGIMYLLGIPLNTVTFAALIVVLGMIVDNAIVIIDGYMHCLNNGSTPHEAAVDSAHKYFMPMFLATACICLLFYPILVLFKGQFAEFTYYFPHTITINLMISLILAVLLVPILEVKFIKPKERQPKNPNHRTITEKVHDVYMRLLGWNFKHPYLTVSVGVLSILVALLIVPYIPFRMMPLAERDQFAVEIYLPDGSPLSRTTAIADSLRKVLQADERVLSVTQFNGMSSPRFQISYAPKMPSESFAQLIVNTGSPKITNEVLNEYTNTYAHFFTGAYVKFKQIDFQHVPTFEFRFSGENVEQLKTAATMLSDRMKTMPQITNVRTDWGEKLPIIDIDLDPVAASRLGLTRGITAANLMFSTDKFTMGSITEDDKHIPIVLKTDKSLATNSLEEVSDIYISTLIPSVSVPLRQVATVNPAWSENTIIHRNGIRTISVMGELKRGEEQGKMLSAVQDIIKTEIIPQLPAGVSYQEGGVPEYNKDNLMPIIYVIITAFVIIFFFLLLTYGKFKLTLVSIFTLMLFMFGSIFGLWISGFTVGLTSVLGLIGLFGITIRNLILMFQHAEQRFVNDGWNAHDAAFDAGKRRMIPIFLTSAAASVGVVPMIVAGSSFWAPVGVVIFAGGVFLLLMTITILPVLYWKLNDKKPKQHTSTD